MALHGVNDQRKSPTLRHICLSFKEAQLQLEWSLAEAVKTSLAEGYHSPIVQQLAEFAQKSVGRSDTGVPWMNAH